MALLLDALGWVLILSGCFFILVGAVGLVRLPDVYSRMHGAGMTDTMGATLLLLGMLLQAPDWLVVVKLMLIAVFLGVTSPTTSHALARAAMAGGIEPWRRPAAAADERIKETVA